MRCFLRYVSVFATIVAGCTPKAPSINRLVLVPVAAHHLLSSNAASQKYVIITYDSGISYWKAAETGIQQAAAELGARHRLLVLLQEDASDEARILSTIASQHPAGIIVPSQRYGLKPDYQSDSCIRHSGYYL